MSSASHCPESNTLVDFAHGRLEEPNLQMVSLHVAECEMCLRTLESIDPSRLETSLRGDLAKDDPSLSSPPTSFIQKTMEILQQERILATSHWGESRLALHPQVSRSGMLIRHLATEQASGISFFAVLARADRVSSKEHRAQFFSDVQLAMQITHPNCEAICDFGMWDASRAYYLAYAFDGVPLRKAMPSTGFEFEKILSILEQCVAGLTAAHRLGITHRHVSANSVFLNSAGQAILFEFGLLYDARYQGDLLATNNLQHRSLAPEVRQGWQKHIDGRCDVYGLGRIAGYMFKRWDLRERTDKGVVDSGPGESIPIGIKELIQASVSNSRRQRPQTPGAFWERLMNCLG